ncbi:hypothetical protein DFH06DRAFT_1200410 [Mycena polygramma]|nr:hypothetical protein DFH06DRAFT_1200410 [Mycena polygramma]
MRTVNTPPRRKSIVNVFSTPPLRRSALSRSRKASAHVPSPFHTRESAAPYPASATDSDDSDDENTLTATGDISVSYPYYVPGVAGALSPKPKSRRGTPNLTAARALQQRPRPPVWRFSSMATDTYKFRTLTIKGGPTPSTPNTARSTHATEQTTPPPQNGSPVPARHPGDESVSSISSFSGSIGSIPDEVSFSCLKSSDSSNLNLPLGAQNPKLSTPQSRFEAFMKSRDLSSSPKKRQDHSLESPALDALARSAATVLGRPNTRPLRGNARLPSRMAIPNWGALDAMDVDERT